MEMERIYADHAATTPVIPEVKKTVLEITEKMFGNPSSIHAFGREARAVVDQARQTASRSIGAKFHEIIFTSGGTEADNLALVGTALANRGRGKHLITTSIEHHAVLKTAEFLESLGFEVTYLPVDESGAVKADAVKRALRDDTILVSVMFANNETGVIQPVKEIGELLQDHPAYFHTDAVQAYGHIPIDVNELHIDLLSVSAHKMNGPKGAGFLYVRDGVKLAPLIHGGEQERRRRAGTENVAAIAGFGKAIEIAMERMAANKAHHERLRDAFIRKLREEGVDFAINGDPEQSLANIINLSFPGTRTDQVLVNLDLEGIAASSGSACTAGSLEPSHVLKAMYGENSPRIGNSVRFSFGYGNTVEQMEILGEKCAAVVKRLSSDGR